MKGERCRPLRWNRNTRPTLPCTCVAPSPSRLWTTLSSTRKATPMVCTCTPPVSSLYSNPFTACPPCLYLHQRERVLRDNAKGSTGALSTCLHGCVVDTLIPTIMCTTERVAIEAWLKSHSTSPMTKSKLKRDQLIPNRASNALPAPAPVSAPVPFRASFQTVRRMPCLPQHLSPFVPLSKPRVGLDRQLSHTPCSLPHAPCPMREQQSCICTPLPLPRWCCCHFVWCCRPWLPAPPPR